MLSNLQISFIASIKEKIRLAQYEALNEALKAVNTHLINLYWEIGKNISIKQTESWGKHIAIMKKCKDNQEHSDHELESALVNKVRAFLLEMVNQQYSPHCGEISTGVSI